MNTPVERILAALREHGHDPRKAGAGWECRCPAHDDRKPSLSIDRGDDGRALVHCHAGCSVEAVCGALGLTPANLFADGPAKRNGHPPKRGGARVYRNAPGASAKANPVDVDTPSKPPKVFPTARDAVAALERRHGPKSAWWVYHNAGGVEVGVVIRWDVPADPTNPKNKPDKEIRPVSLTPDGWACVGMPTPRPLHGLPALLATNPGDRVYVCEGEKAADAARAVGLVATTSPHGCEAAAKADWSPMAERDVVILPDHDDAGEKYADDVARLATGAGAKSVRVVRLFELWAGMPKGGDMADFVEYRGGDVDPIRAEVEALADAAPELSESDIQDLQATSALSESGAEPAPTFKPIAASELIRQYPTLRPVVIDGLLREGETMNVVAAPKIGKSWLVHALALAVASGSEWLGQPTTRGRVLLIDGELHKETLADRLRAVQQRLGVFQADMGAIDIWSVRGMSVDIHQIAARLAGIPAGKYRLLMLDALYRFLPANMEENSNEAMMRVYNTLDAIGKQTGAAVTVVHHASKGSQADKAVTDVGSGAGAQSRAVDTHLVLRLHEADDAVVVDAAVRSFAPVRSFVIRSTKPGWELAPDLDPAALRKSRRSRGVAKATAPARLPRPKMTPKDFAEQVVGRYFSIREDVIDRALARGLSRACADALLKQALDAGLVHRHINGPSTAHRFSIDPPTNPPDAGRRGEGLPTPTPGAFAPGGLGGRALPPSPPPEPPKTGNPDGEVLL